MFDSWGRAVYRRRRLVLEIAAIAVIAVALLAAWSSRASCAVTRRAAST